MIRRPVEPRPHVRFGYRRDTKDQRDHLFAPKPMALPPAVDLRPHCPPVMDQGELGSCHDDQTEILTDRGWVPFPDLTGGERLATVDPATSALSYERPVRLTRMPYQGKLICARNQSLDFRVTPDHKMLVRPWDEAARTLGAEYKLVPAKALGWYCGLLNRVAWAGENRADHFTLPGVEHKHKLQREPASVPMKAWLHFLGIYAAEGTMLKPEQKTGRLSYKVQIAAFKPREKDFVRDVLAAIGVTALELADRFTFENKRVYEAMRSLGLLGIKASHKRVPEFVFWQSAEDIRAYLFGHFMGDGSQDAGGVKAHYTSSVGLADDIQRLMFLAGYESRISVREARSSVTADGRQVIGRYPEHRVSMCERKNLSIERKRSLFEEDYDGEVFCAEVPTHHTLVTRRNGKVLVSGNCTAHAITGALRFCMLKAGKPDLPLSRLQLYYDERAIEGTTASDAGAEIRDGIKTAAKLGVGPEVDWPYNPLKFARKPPAKVYKDALAFQALTYQRVPVSTDSLKAALATGFPVVIGLTLYESFESDAVAATGMVPMPGLKEKVAGGHAILCVGYGQKPGTFTVQNSWGSDWGDAGRCYFPEAYLGSTKLGSDYWLIQTVG